MGLFRDLPVAGRRFLLLVCLLSALVVSLTFAAKPVVVSGASVVLGLMAMAFMAFSGIKL